ncbi:MAG: hypothetical protein KF782_12140 [Labilithrix sp.]|nr:hypothetical protein [Labilithrix sp.]
MSAWRCTLVSGAGFACALAGALVTSCASKDESANLDPDDVGVVVPERDAGGADGADGGEACIEDDCELFPAECEPGALCPSGLFGAHPSGGVDWRTRLETIRARAATDAWVVGTVGVAAHFDGTEWKLVDVGTLESLRYVWPANGGELTFGTLDRVFTRGLGAGEGAPSPDGWAARGKVTPPSGAGSYVTAAWGRTGSRTMWVATSAEVWRIDADGTTLSPTTGVPTSVCSHLPCTWLRSLDGVSPNVVWGVGETGAAIRITDASGESPSVEVMNPLTWSTLNGVWAVSDTEAWAVGARGLIIHNVGATFDWRAAEAPTEEHLNAVAGSSSSDVWAVGDKGVVLHYDGTTWSRVKVAGMGRRRPELLSVWVPEPGKVWIGGQGVLLSLGGKR